MTGRRIGPQLSGGQGATYTAPELQRRVRAFTIAVTFTKACELLSTGQETLLAARDGGRLRADTIARLMEALDREEAALLERRRSA